MTLEYLLPWFPVLIIASYLPALIIMDLKTRTVEYEAWIGMLPLFPATGYLYAVGFYPIEALWISLVFIGIYFAAMKLHWIEGADFTLLMFISLFFVVNPISGRILMPLVLAEYLLALFVSVNLITHALRERIEQFPMIPLITIAFAAAVIFG